MAYRHWLIISLLIFLCNIYQPRAYAQALDSAAVKKKFYQTTAFKGSLVPAGLIAYGLSTIHDHGLYSSYQAKQDIQSNIHARTKIDNYLQYSPLAGLLVLNALKVKGKNDYINTGLLVLKSELLMLVLVHGTKNIVHMQRPDSSNYHSFPSGHTAQAFVAAAIFDREFRHKSIWYGVGAYAVAASVGALRMINNKHWESDVFAGAGFGLLSAHLVYITHRYKWGKNTSLMPAYNGRSAVLNIVYRF